jgi:uncharacterized protein (TIGR02246 family)
MKGNILIVLAVLFVSGCQQKVDTQADVEAVKSVVEQNFTAFNDGNVDGFLQVATEDAIYLPPNNPPLIGKEAIRNWYNLDILYIDCNLSMKDVHVSGDLAVARQITTCTMKLKDSGKPVMINKPFTNLNVLRKQSDGSWKISHAMWNQDETQLSRAVQGDTVWVLLNHVKADKREQFEKFISDVLIPAATKLSKTDSKRAASRLQTRTLFPAAKNEDGTYTYVWLMDPVVAGLDYSFKGMFSEIYTPDETEKYIKMFNDALVEPQIRYTLIQKGKQL